MKQEFEMTQQEMDDIIAINKNKMPVMKIGNVTTGMDTQERVNNYWEVLGNKYGFKHMTVEPSSKGKLFFLAEPKPIEVPKTQTEIEIDKYIGNAMEYLNYNVKDALKKIVEQFEMCDYKEEGGSLKTNIAFLALKKLAGAK
jgi:hypothetical protein